MRKLAAALSSILVTTLAITAFASTVLQMTIEDLTKFSNKVVVGKVAGTTSFKSDDKILTSIEIEVDETWKGDHSERVEIIHYGGTFEGLRTYVPGMPQFVAGERVLLFLERPKNQPHFVVTGMSQGKFKIANAPDGLTPYAIPEFADTSLLKNGVHAEPSADHTATHSLQSIKTRIKSTIK